MKLFTQFYLEINVDNSGKIISTGNMKEIVKIGSVNIGQKVYGPGTVLLAGTVYDFGWGEGQLLGQFDFLVKDLYGALINDGIWPSVLPTGIFAIAEKIGGWDGSWDKNFTLTRVKGDKAALCSHTHHPDSFWKWLFRIGRVR